MESEIINIVAKHLASLGTEINHLGDEVIQTSKADEEDIALAAYLAGLEAAAKVADPDERMNVRDYETAEQIAAAIRKLKGGE